MLHERSLNLVQRQSLQMSTQTIQSLKILQFSHDELVAYVEEQAERNPLIEVAAPVALAPPQTSPAGMSASGAGLRTGSAAGDDLDTVGSRCSQTVTLRQHLQAQAALAFRDPVDRRIADELVEALDADGYLRSPLAVVAQAQCQDLERVEEVLAVVQDFDPAGVAARDLAECLRLQLADRGLLTGTMDRLLSHLDLLARCDIARLADMIGTDRTTVMQMARLIRTLDPRPGRRFDVDPVLPALPDVLVSRASDGQMLVEVNSDLLPRVLVNRQYYAQVSARAQTERDKRFVCDCLNNATFLVRNLDQRAQTLLKVATEIALRQEQFLLHGPRHLRPLGLRDVAEAIGVHESTVCRAIADKFMMTPHGMFEMKFFLSNAIAGTDGADDQSSETVRQKIRTLVEGESATAVLSDDAIVALLRRDGIVLARRTVAKYRDALRIPSSAQRRRMKLAGLDTVA